VAMLLILQNLGIEDSDLRITDKDATAKKIMNVLEGHVNQINAIPGNLPIQL